MALPRVCGFLGHIIFRSAARLFSPNPPTHRAERTSSAKMADAAAAEMQQMKVEEEKKEVVTALAGAFGVAPPVDNGCVARDPTLFRDRARACLLAPTLRRRSRSPAGAGTIDRPGSRRTARAWRARRALRASSFAPFDPPPERLPPRRARRVAHAPTSRSAD